ncbi:MAG TPA: LolA-related protein [Frateuria sp.]|uniref:LolA-related protein n=1 Tax=Frateuria sp. TaxID=2211372 RepID=UPI002D8050D2|nr:LolA-related protein [Frateuria sp.]HET6805719.1 LolA-related protein [Frateuria sp.]
MTSGSKIGAALCILVLACSANASAPDATDTLISKLGRPAPARTAFAEARFMQLLDRPLVVSGELAWLGGDTLERHVTRPHEETARIADGKVTQQRAGKGERSFSLERAPQLKVLVDSFVALLGGDPGRLRQAFAITRRGDAGGVWTLTLTPRDLDVARTVATIRIDGKGALARCMWMQEADGDVAVDLLGALAARMPAAPTREALTALCQGQ